MQRSTQTLPLLVLSTVTLSAFLFCPPGAEGSSSSGPRPSAARSSPGTQLLCGEVYKWTDEQGGVHFTDDPGQLPAAGHGQVESMELPDHPAPSKPAGPAPETGSDAGASADSSAYEDCMKRVAEKKEELSKQLEEDQQKLDGLGKNLEKERAEDGGTERTQRPLRDKPVRTRDKRKYKRSRSQLRENVDETQEKLKTEIRKMEEECQKLQ